MTGLPKHVRIVRSILHPYYRVKGKGYDTVVEGVSTAILASRFVAGESLYATSGDYYIPWDRIYDAIRWELIPRRTRVRIVERLAK